MIFMVKKREQYAILGLIVKLWLHRVEGNDMKDKICRIIKIDKDALFEFIYENFISQEEVLLDLKSSVGISNNFDINWETGEFIFMAHKGEDADENIISLPKDVDIKKVMEKIPATTNSVFNPGKNYKDFTFDELSKIVK